jgi:hypothetical protein
LIPIYRHKVFLSIIEFLPTKANDIARFILIYQNVDQYSNLSTTF